MCVRGQCGKWPERPLLFFLLNNYEKHCTTKPEFRFLNFLDFRAKKRVFGPKRSKIGKNRSFSPTTFEQLYLWVWNFTLMWHLIRRNYVASYDVIGTFEFRYLLISNANYTMKKRIYFKSEDLFSCEKDRNFRKFNSFLLSCIPSCRKMWIYAEIDHVLTFFWQTKRKVLIYSSAKRCLWNSKGFERSPQCWAARPEGPSTCLCGLCQKLWIKDIDNRDWYVLVLLYNNSEGGKVYVTHTFRQRWEAAGSAAGVFMVYILDFHVTTKPEFWLSIFFRF